MEASNKKVKLFVQPTKNLGDVAVMVCFKANVDECSLCQLYKGSSCGCLNKLTPAAAVLFSLYLAAEDKLCGNPLATKNSRVGRVDLGYANGHATLSWKMKGVVSHVRKAVSLCVSALKPGSLYSLYGHSMRALGGKVKREHFNAAAKKQLSDLNQGVDVIVVGKVKIDKAKANDTVKKIAVKLNPGDVKGTSAEYKDTSAEYKETTPCDKEFDVKLKVSGWKAFLTYDYITSKARGVRPVMRSNALLIPMKQASYAALKKKLTKQVADFVKQKYAKLGDECGPVLAYQAIGNGCVSYKDVKDLCKLSVGKVGAAIKEGL